MELKIHDKEEIAWKQLNSQHKDKDGLKENELRQKLIGIMSSYDLLEHFEDTQDVDKTKPYKVNNFQKPLRRSFWDISIMPIFIEIPWSRRKTQE